ncbi:DUF3667 domain-containing protein [Ginsengibacter hankyongi]|uniref:DUF3667 domain-containing protein n=2 Tax=Ginsengibacter hankyongi TaxID=2607284 RepID=A0A5J5IEF4_9BACT|nr:DUF3667 domain-containing protein [Ginsengibacter hankyongi]
MSTICLNCGHHFKGNYCPNCGQKATVERITATSLMADVLHVFTHLEKGFLFTTWSFLIKPGISSINYISGKRKQFQTPVSYFLIWTGLYIVLHDKIVNHFNYLLSGEVITQLDKSGEANRLLQKHFTLFIIPAVFACALSIYYVLARPKYNFTELLVLSLYGGGTYFMMLFLSDIVLGIICKVNVLNAPVFLWQTALSFLYNFWFSFDIFKRARLRLFWLRLICAAILVAITGWIILFYLPIAWLYLTKQ